MGPEPLSDLRFEKLRAELVDAIRAQGVRDPAVLRAFAETPRHLFLPAAVQHRAYEDSALPIGYGQTASQPSLQARFLEAAGLRGTERVLEVGTGSGYQTALLARLAANVYSVERVRELSLRARATLDRLRIANVALLVGDGTVGWSRYAPYDAILVTAAAPDIPGPLLQQLAPGGRLLIPLGDRREQRLTLIRKTETGTEAEPLAGCVFVPLVGRFGWPE